MRFVRLMLTLMMMVAVWTSAPTQASAAGQTTHTVQKGQTLGGVARRYHVTIEGLCKANGIRRSDPIRPGQKLRIPSASTEQPTPRTPSPSRDNTPQWTEGEQELQVPGAPPAYFYEPLGRGRLTQRPVIVVLHGRGGDPQSDCRRWAPIARPHGWLVCPSGPDVRGGGRTWNNDWVTGRQIVMGTIRALRAKYGRRVQLYGNTLVGFSEGAFVAMNVAVREARAFNRWLILAADDSYWGAAGESLLARARSAVRRVVLITGKLDGVYDGTLQVQRMLKAARIPVRVSAPTDMGHQVALESKPAIYRAALGWLL